jgi:ADP-heptose:LPS heptosyltransferase
MARMQLRGAVLYSNKRTLVQVYPELEDIIEEVDRLIESNKCKGCAQNKYTRRIVAALIKLSPEGRDLTPLKTFLNDKSLEALGAGGGVVPQASEDCPHCVEKHMASVAVLMAEVANGYDHHLSYAQAHYDEAKREGYQGPELTLSKEKATEVTGLIFEYLGIPIDRARFIGLLNVLGELAPEYEMQESLREERMRLQTIDPPSPAPVPRKELPPEILIKCNLSPGDILMLTAAVRDLKKAVGNRMKIAVDTSCSQLWENNPHIVKAVDRKKRKVIKASYTDAVRNCNQRPHHFIEGYRQHLEQELDMHIPAKGSTGQVFLSEKEKTWGTWMKKHLGDPKPYWVINPGYKTDMTTKAWPAEYWQTVVDSMKGRLHIVQAGKRNTGRKMEHVQPKLDGVIDMVNKTSYREMVQLMYHSMGATCGITFFMHLSAALPPLPGTELLHRPCVVIAGGREPAHWEMYQHHIYFHNCGLYSCNRRGGCWKCRTVKLSDNNRKRNSSLCANPISFNDGFYPKCMEDITPSMVISAMNRYLDTMRNPYD